jgi:hypothetical protein
MAKISFLLLLFFSLSHSSMYLGGYQMCIEDFELRGQTLYIQASYDGNYYSTSKDIATIHDIIPGFIYDAENNKCLPDAYFVLGMDATHYYFLMALIGLIFGGVFMYFSTQIFMNVGGRR